MNNMTGQRRKEATDFEKFIIELTKHLSSRGEVMARVITDLGFEMVKLAGRYQRLQEMYCERELTPLELRQEEKIEKQFRELCIDNGLVAKFGGDPRGYTVKVFFAHPAYNTWGGLEEGYGVPTSTRS